MNEQKLKVYKIVHHQFLTLIRVGFWKGTSNPLGNICEILHRRNLPLRFFSLDLSLHGSVGLNVGVDLLSEEMVEHLLEELITFSNRRELSLVSQVSMSMIYGPHFGERPGLLGLLVGSLSNFGVTPLALSASASSLCCLFPATQFRQVLESLYTIFEPPAAYFHEKD